MFCMWTLRKAHGNNEGEHNCWTTIGICLHRRLSARESKSPDSSSATFQAAMRKVQAAFSLIDFTLKPSDLEHSLIQEASKPKAFQQTFARICSIHFDEAPQTRNLSLWPRALATWVTCQGSGISLWLVHFKSANENTLLQFGHASYLVFLPPHPIPVALWARAPSLVRLIQGEIHKRICLTVLVVLVIDGFYFLLGHFPLVLFKDWRKNTLHF